MRNYGNHEHFGFDLTPLGSIVNCCKLSIYDNSELTFKRGQHLLANLDPDLTAGKVLTYI